MKTKKPIEIVKSKMSKAQRMARSEAEMAYKVGRLRLLPPDELTERAKDHFEAIANEAFWLDELSTDLLAAYCQAWDRWLTLVEQMNEQPDVIVTQTKTGQQAKGNPNRTALLQYATLMQSLSAKLALGNVDRLRLSLPTEDKKENKFAEFMSEVN